MNRFISIIFLSFIFVYVPGCKDKVSSEKVAANNLENNSQKAYEMFDYNNLDLQIGYVEKKFNISPMHKEDKSATYKMGNCEIELGLDKNKNINSITFNTSTECILNIENGNTETVKLGDIMLKAHKDGLPGTLIVTCPSTCGHTQDTEYTYISHGSSASGFQSISYTSVNPDGDYEWTEKVKQKLNLDNLDDDLTFTGNDELFNIARTTFKNGNIKSVSIFREP